MEAKRGGKKTCTTTNASCQSVDKGKLTGPSSSGVARKNCEKRRKQGKNSIQSSQVCPDEARAGLTPIECRSEEINLGKKKKERMPQSLKKVYRSMLLPSLKKKDS